jgi:hypothetical protein
MLTRLPRPGRLQLIPFTVFYFVDHSLQIAIWQYLCHNTPVLGPSLFKSPQRGYWHLLWDQARSSSLIILSIAATVLSATFPYQLSYSIFCGILVVLIPTSKTFARFNKIKWDQLYAKHDGEAPYPEGAPVVHGSGEQIVEIIDSELLQQECSIEGPDRLSLLQTLRQRLPWSTPDLPNDLSTEEFMLLAQDCPASHPYFQGTPSQYNIAQCHFRNDLQDAITNFHTHSDQCTECSEGLCGEIFHLMCMILLDTVKFPMRVRLDQDDLISKDGATISEFLLTSMHLEKMSKVVLKLERRSIERVIEIPRNNLWKINSIGLYITLSAEAARLLPYWSGHPC